MAGHFAHDPVLLSESLEFLDPRTDAVIVDGTVGGGGHAAAILERTGPAGQLIALDRDADALTAARARLAPYGDRVRFIQASFREIGEVLARLGLPRVDGILFDLGVSSPQLDLGDRGFGFSHGDAPLDMRMDRDAAETAADLLQRLPAEELARCFHEYGELRGARRLARAVVAARKRAPLRTVADLLAVVESAGVGGGRRHHPATLVFQALRIAVNDELAALDSGLEAAIDALLPERRIVVIAYHSLEDRIVKHRFREAVRGCVCPPRAPICTCGGVPKLELLTRRPVRPGADEVRANPRARSARLRAARRLPEAL